MRRTTRALNDDEKSGPTGKLSQLQPGVTLQDRYLILGIVGTGGMSSVYRGRDLHFPNVTKVVAVKEMINLASDPTMYEMVLRNFEREADLLATLSHAAIPRIYDYFSHDKSSYLVMEFVQGKDLEAIVRSAKGFLPVEDVVQWGIELCEVLSFLHAQEPQPVIFRDMKPANVMIDHHEQIRLIDFGIARVFQPGEKGTMIGTEGYSPPEQYRGEASPAGDIYALGATLHHLLTRRDPRAEPPFSFGERPIDEINPDVSPELVKVINGALSYDTKDRYPSAQAMKEALIGAAAKTGLLPVRPARASESKSDPSVTELWSFECEDEVRSTPIVHQGTVYMGCYDNNLYALDAKEGTFKWKYPTDGGIPSRPAAEEDMIFIASEDHRLYAISDEGTLLWTYYTDGPIRSSPIISEGHLFFGSDDAKLHVVNLLNGNRAWRAEAASPIRSTPFIANERVYFGSESGDFYCFDFRGEQKWRFKAKRAITSSPVVVDGVVFFGSMDWTFYALEAEGGWQIWRFRLGRPTISSPVHAEGKIFTGCADGNIYAIDARTSTESWRYETEHQVTGSPIVHEDSLYCGSVDGAMYCIDMRSGRLRWKFDAQGPITGTPAIWENILYFGSHDHRIYALLT